MVGARQISEVGSDVNEDLVWVGENAAVVLDGATGLSERHMSDFETDGQWYVNTLLDELKEVVTREQPLSNGAVQSVERVEARYQDLAGDGEVEEHELPSAAGAIVRWTGNFVEYLVLGDCTVICSGTDFNEVISGEGPRELDEKVVEEMVSIRESNEAVSYEELRSKVSSLLIEHRKLKNKPGGYWTFGLRPEAVDHAKTGSVHREEVDTVLAFTDGFDPIVSVFDVFIDWENLVSYVVENGLNRAVRVLRAFEAADPECREHPRLKPSDDVGIAEIDFGA